MVRWPALFITMRCRLQTTCMMRHKRLLPHGARLQRVAEANFDSATAPRPCDEAQRIELRARVGQAAAAQTDLRQLAAPHLP